MTSIAAFVMQFIVCFRLREDASELTSALVILFCLFQQWSALTSNPDPLCNPYADSAGNATARLSLNLIVTFVAMFTAAATFEDEEPVKTSLNEPFLESALDAANAKSVESKGQANAMTAEATTMDKREDATVSTAKPVAHQDSKFAISNQTIMFQVLFCIASIYYAMLLTNWGSPDTLT